MSKKLVRSILCLTCLIFSCIQLSAMKMPVLKKELSFDVHRSGISQQGKTPILIIGDNNNIEIVLSEKEKEEKSIAPQANALQDRKEEPSLETQAESDNQSSKVSQQGKTPIMIVGSNNKIKLHMLEKNEDDDLKKIILKLLLEMKRSKEKE